MKSFYIITNESKDPGFTYTKHISDYLMKECPSCKVTWDEQVNRDGKYYTDAANIPEDTECIIVLGGDGTVLQAARDTIDKRIPLIGINLGTLGYLTEIEVGQMDEALQKLLQDDFTIEERMMLSGSVNGEETQSHALNDIVITRSGEFQIIKYDIYVNGLLLNSCQADGIVLATPTGSTGYNMSAGGPIVEPGANLILLTPICPHTLNSRSIVLAPEDEVRIEIPGKQFVNQTAEVHFDGKESRKMTSGDQVTIHKSVRTTRIIKLNQESFLTVLQKKMNGA